MRFQLCLLSLVCGAAFGQNVLLDPRSVANAASQIAPGYPTGGVPHGATFIVKAATGSLPLGVCGVKLADAFPIAANMNGTTMKIAMGANSFDVPMIYVVACQGTDQLAGIVPSAVPAGTGTLTVSYNGHSGSTPITVTDRGPGLFTINQGGTGVAIVQNFVDGGALPINTLATPARPGQPGILWGTGLGPDGNSDVNAPVPTDIPIDLELYVGGKRASVTYKGRSGCCAGIDQIVFQVPDGVDGCFVPVVAKVGNSVSNFTTMSVSADGSPCSDANGFTAAQVRQASQKNLLRVGMVDLFASGMEQVPSPNTGSVTRYDTASAAFANLPYRTLIGLPVREISSTGACTVWRDNDPAVLANRTPLLAPYMNLDAGTLTIGGVSASAAINFHPGAYNRTLGTSAYREPAGGPPASAGFLDPGAVSVSGQGGGPSPGGPAIGAFNAQAAMAPTPAFTNRFSLDTVQRSQGVTVNWSGTDPAAVVEIRGISLPTDPTLGGVAFFCQEKASAGQFTIPPYVLLSLPASANSTVVGLGVGVSTMVRFSAPGLDAGFLRVHSFLGRNVTFR